MKGSSPPKYIFLIFIICLNFDHSLSQPVPYQYQINQLNQTSQWRNTHTEYYLPLHTILAGALCFVAAIISTAGGIGGGGLYVPILNIIGGLTLKTASSFSAFMVTGGSATSVIYNLCIKRSKSFVDYDVALLSQPCLLLGVSIGVICNVVCPEWLITLLFTVFLGFSTFKTCRAGAVCWNAESHRICEGDGEGMEEHLLGGNRVSEVKVPWKDLGMLMMIWFCFLALHVLCGGRDRQSVLEFEPCGTAYWIITSLQIPFAMIFTLWMLYQRRRKDEYQSSNPQLIYPLVALLAGALGGFSGTGGGMLISPIFLHIGLPPEVTASTCSFMVFFSSSMSTAQYILLGMERQTEAIIFSSTCFLASFLGLLIVQNVLKHGRASVIVFSVGTVMALSTVMITTFGALDVWRDYRDDNYMGFKQFCAY